jgi:hypothetical protein
MDSSTQQTSVIKVYSSLISAGWKSFSLNAAQQLAIPLKPACQACLGVRKCSKMKQGITLTR